MHELSALRATFGISSQWVGFPSTTASSLASLATAADSGAHGLVGAAFNLEDRLFNPSAWQLYDPLTGGHGRVLDQAGHCGHCSSRIETNFSAAGESEAPLRYTSPNDRFTTGSIRGMLTNVG